jgi:hypothetical protein
MATAWHDDGSMTGAAPLGSNSSSRNRRIRPSPGPARCTARFLWRLRFLVFQEPAGPTSLISVRVWCMCAILLLCGVCVQCDSSVATVA